MKTKKNDHIFFTENNTLYTWGHSCLLKEADSIMSSDDLLMAGRCRELTDEERQTGQLTITDEDLETARRYTQHGLRDIYLHYQTDIFDDFERDVVNGISRRLKIKNLAEKIILKYLISRLSDLPYNDTIAHAIVEERTDSYADAEGMLIEKMVDVLIQDVMTPAEVEEEFDLQPGTVRQACRQGRVICRKADNRTWLIHREEARFTWARGRGRESIEPVLSANNFNSSSLRISSYESFFPHDAFGKRSKKHGMGKLLTLELEGFDEPLQTDIDGHKKIFRRRSWGNGRYSWRKFYELHGLSEGDRVRIEKISDYHYRIRPLPGSGAS